MLNITALRYYYLQYSMIHFDMQSFNMHFQVAKAADKFLVSHKPPVQHYLCNANTDFLMWVYI